MDDTKQIVLGGLIPLKKYVAALDRSERTGQRWVSLGMPVVRIGQEPFVDPPAALEWFKACCPPASSRSTPRRRARKAA